MPHSACPQGTDVATAAACLRRGQLVAIPTETVYGLAGHALDAQAVARIFQAKGRPHFDPLIVHAPSAQVALALASEVPPAARQLAEAFWPGPLTLVLPRSPQVPDLVCSGLPTVGLRVPRHPLTQALLEAFGGPLAAPSANRFGQSSPTRPAHVQAQLGHKLCYLLDGGPAQVGLESTIVAFPPGEAPMLLRLGGLSQQQIEATLGQPVQRARHSTDQPQAPGQLSRHYAPSLPLFVLEEGEALPQGYAPQALGALPWQQPLPGIPEQHQFVLAPDGHTTTGAQRLFEGLQLAGTWPVRALVAQWAPPHGLGPAINDRLQRAAVPPTPSPQA